MGKAAEILGRRLRMKYCHTRGFFRHRPMLQEIISQPVIFNTGCIYCDTFCVLPCCFYIGTTCNACKGCQAVMLSFLSERHQVSEERQNNLRTWQQRGSALTFMLRCKTKKAEQCSGVMNHIYAETISKNVKVFDAKPALKHWVSSCATESAEHPCDAQEEGGVCRSR